MADLFSTTHISTVYNGAGADWAKLVSGGEHPSLHIPEDILNSKVQLGSLLSHQIIALTKDKMDAQLLGMTHESYYVTKYNTEPTIYASGSEVENLYGATTDTEETLKDYLGLALFQNYMSDEYSQVLYSDANVDKEQMPMPEIWLPLYTVTPKDVHIDEHKLTDLAQVPDEQRLPSNASSHSKINP